MSRKYFKISEKIFHFGRKYYFMINMPHAHINISLTTYRPKTKNKGIYVLDIFIIIREVDLYAILTSIFIEIAAG